MTTATAAWVGRNLGPIAKLTYVERVRVLKARGCSNTGAKAVAVAMLITCSRCQREVSMVKGGNKRQRADGGVDHVKC